ncbi:MAG TPA: YicC/YloC family endoribonuclease [Bdellovibrionota bacterium]|nr:YicC/YloC family endoribonuclease [Bdellovibrionota bacterium]
MADRLRSMTGFATAETQLRGRTYRVEIKTFNHRFLEAKVRAPRAFGACEPQIRQWLQKGLGRGSVDLKIEPAATAEAGATEWRLNTPALRYYAGEMRTLARDLGISSEIRLGDLMQLPDALVRENDGIEGGRDSSFSADEVEPLVRLALEGLIKSREAEGALLKIALERSLDSLADIAGRLRVQRKQCQDQAKEAVAKRVRAAFEAHPLPTGDVGLLLESRIAQELALILDRTDVEEELTRLEGHLTQARQVLQTGSPAGRKLDFLLQEMNREVNTLANKAQDLGMSNDAVDAKLLVEQLREQSLNVE